MKRVVSVLLAALLAVTVCGCNGENGNSLMQDDTDNNIGTVNTGSNNTQASVITKNHNDSVSAPSESISFEKACEMLDNCGMDDLYLTQRIKDYQKYYFATVDYYGNQYYSIYLYTENGDKKIFVGTNILVACSGAVILKKNWLGNYEKVDFDGAEADKSLEELYPNAKITPIEAAKVLADKKELGLEYDLSKYVFEFSDKAVDIQSINCFAVTPKVEFTDSTQFYKKLYIATDGSGRVFQAAPHEKGEYIELS